MSLTADLSDDFFRELVAMCDELAPCKPLDILGCWFSESEVRAKAIDPNGYASGIFQAMPGTLRALGYDPGGLSDKAISVSFSVAEAKDQLYWARKFYKSYTGSLGSVGACYVATFLPAELAHAMNPAWVLCASPGEHPGFPNGKYVDAYRDNQVFDPAHKGWIAVEDLVQHVTRVTVGNARWAEIRARTIAAEMSAGHFDLDDARGLQRALAALGFDPGPIDGIVGPATNAAIARFRGAPHLPSLAATDLPTLRVSLQAALAKASTVA